MNGTIGKKVCEPQVYVKRGELHNDTHEYLKQSSTKNGMRTTRSMMDIGRSIHVSLVKRTIHKQHNESLVFVTNVMRHWM